MKKAFVENFKPFFGVVLLLGAFSGLLFSSAEGVRLLPFPDSKAENQTDWRGKNEIPYQYNAHRFENSQASYKSKPQQNHRDDFWSGGFVRNELPVLFSSNDAATESSHAARNFYSRVNYNFLGCRAPPFVI